MRFLQICLVLAVAAATTSRGAGGEENSILPGEGIGHIRLGAAPASVVNLLGSPSQTTGGPEGSDTWVSASDGHPAERTEVLYKPDRSGKPVAWQIGVTSAFFHTRGGNSTHSSMEALWREFPDLHYRRYGDKGDTSHIQMYDDVEKGVALMVQLRPHPAAGESWGTCRAIIVHRPGERPALVDLGSVTP